MIATARAVLGYDILEAGGFGELVEVLPILKGTLKLHESKQTSRQFFILYKGYRLMYIYIDIMNIRNTTSSQAAMNTNKPFQIWRFEDL